MPCYQVNTVSVEFKAQNQEILFHSLEELKARYTLSPDKKIVSVDNLRINLETQKVEMRDYKRNYDRLNEIKRKYSEVVVKQMARKKKWAVRQSANNQFTLKRF